MIRIKPDKERALLVFPVLAYVLLATCAIGGEQPEAASVVTTLRRSISQADSRGGLENARRAGCGEVAARSSVHVGHGRDRDRDCVSLLGIQVAVRTGNGDHHGGSIGKCGRYDHRA